MIHLQPLNLLVVARQKLVVWLFGLSIVASLYIVKLLDGEFRLYNSFVVLFFFAAHTADDAMITKLRSHTRTDNLLYLLMTEFDRLFV